MIDTSAQTKSFIIGFEEHYSDPELASIGRAEHGGSFTHAHVADLESVRLQAMDEAGIDVQVLSHVSSSLQKMGAEDAVALARRVNDRLHEAVRARPDRFAAFAALPTTDPLRAADELERTVGELGF